MTQELYILTHKKLEYDINKKYYIPLQCGAALTGDDLYPVKDNTGNNISKKNNLFLETTGIYWIWQNSNADIKGQMQFRRLLSVNPDFIKNILKNHDIITASPIITNPNIYAQYVTSHGEDDLIIIKSILEEYYPDYVKSYEETLNLSNMIYANSFIAKKEIYNNLCSFIFNVLIIFENRYGLYNDEILTQYVNNKGLDNLNNTHEGELDKLVFQKRICGALFERLLNVYIYHNKLKTYTCGQYILTGENKM